MCKSPQAIFKPVFQSKDGYKDILDITLYSFIGLMLPKSCEPTLG